MGQFKGWTEERVKNLKAKAFGGVNTPKPPRSKYGNTKVGGNDSISENSFKYQLQAANIPFTEKEEIVLFEGFEYMGQKIRPIKIQPDFFIWHPTFTDYLVAVVDTKHITGYSKTKKGKTPIVGTAKWRVQWKMLKRALQIKYGRDVPTFTPVKKSEKDNVILELIALINK